LQRVGAGVLERVTVHIVRLAVVKRWAWVLDKRRAFREAPRQSEREMLSSESHYVWGKHLRLRVVERAGHAHLEGDSGTVGSGCESD